MLLTSILIYIKMFLLTIFQLNPHIDYEVGIYNVITDFETHIKYNQEILDLLKEQILEYNQLNLKAYDREEIYFSNPLNTFSFTKRLCVDWSKIELFIKNTRKLYVIRSLRQFLKFPENDDISNSIANMFWLQDVYNLTASNLIKGIINGIQYNTSMNIEECVLLGFAAYNKKDYYHSIIWFNESLNKIIASPTNSQNIKILEYIAKSHYEMNKIVARPANSQRIIILEYIAKSYYEIGDIKTAIHFIEEILKLSPDDEVSKEDHKRLNANISNHRPNNIFNTFPINLYTNNSKSSGIDKFPKLCLDEQKLNAKRIRYLNFKNYLSCHYVNNNNPFLLIAPFKIEIVSEDPLVAIFHDAINDEEIQTLIEISKPQLHVAQVEAPEKNGSEFSKMRVSKVYFFYTRPEIILKLKTRVKDFTTLDLNSTEDSINKYELGGFYAVHFDFLQHKEFYGRYRIATFIFYLNDVEQGGATIFPSLNITVWPKKGSALFWYNLHPSGEPDLRTAHAGCPVLVGEKWS